MNLCAWRVSEILVPNDKLRDVILGRMRKKFNSQACSLILVMHIYNTPLKSAHIVRP